MKILKILASNSKQFRLYGILKKWQIGDGGVGGVGGVPGVSLEGWGGGPGGGVGGGWPSQILHFLR